MSSNDQSYNYPFTWRFLDLGRRMERTLQTLNLLRHSLLESPQAGGFVLEAILEIADCVDWPILARFCVIPAGVSVWGTRGAAIEGSQLDLCLLAEDLPLALLPKGLIFFSDQSSACADLAVAPASNARQSP